MVASEPYRTLPAPDPPDPYLVAWETWRSRRRAKWVLFFAWPFVARYILGAMVTAHVLSEDTLVYGWLGAGLLALLWMGRLSTLDCPRCGARMFIFGWWNDRTGDGCDGCGLPLGTPHGER